MGVKIIAFDVRVSAKNSWSKVRRGGPEVLKLKSLKGTLVRSVVVLKCVFVCLDVSESFFRYSTPSSSSSSPFHVDWSYLILFYSTPSYSTPSHSILLCFCPLLDLFPCAPYWYCSVEFFYLPSFSSVHFFSVPYLLFASCFHFTSLLLYSPSLLQRYLVCANITITTTVCLTALHLYSA